MLVVFADIHVLGSPLMSVVVTKMQDFTSEFSKIFRG